MEIKSYTDLTEEEKLITKRAIEACLRIGTSVISFYKANGEVRIAQATLRSSTISEALDDTAVQKEFKPVNPKAESLEQCRFFDTDINEFRAFSIKNLISINGIQLSDLVTI